MISFGMKDIYNKIFGTGFSTNKEVLEQIRKIEKEMIACWVDSGYSDLSFYNTDRYLSQCILSYFVTSKPTVAATLKFIKGFVEAWQRPVRIFDDYNGIGLTTAQFSDARFGVFFFNDNEKQCFWVEQIHRDFGLVLPVRMLDRSGKYDFVVSLEVCEHFMEPIVYLEDLVDMVDVGGCLIIATSFSPASPIYLGHYDRYVHLGRTVNKTMISRLKNNLLKDRFDLVAKGWNGKPVVWKKKSKRRKPVGLLY